jgi:hypothetical protein
MESVSDVLDKGDLNRIADCARVAKLGTMLSKQGSTVVQTAAVTITLDPPAKGPHSVAVRVTGGAAAAGPRQVTDHGGTPSATVATLSADGATLTFEGNVTDAVISYDAAPDVDLATTDIGTAP